MQTEPELLKQAEESFETLKFLNQTLAHPLLDSRSRRTLERQKLSTISKHVDIMYALALHLSGDTKTVDIEPKSPALDSEEDEEQPKKKEPKPRIYAGKGGRQ